MFGHQVVAHLSDEKSNDVTSEVDGKKVPIRHFGVILEMDAWGELVSRLREYGTEFIVEPQVRFEGLPGEQATCFFLDPSGNALEFKAFRDDAQVFQA